MGDDFLKTQLRQVELARETALKLQQAAEQQYRVARTQLKLIVSSLLAPEWVALVEKTPGATDWLPLQLGAWIVEAGTSKLNRLELSAGGDLPAMLATYSQERDRWRTEAEQSSREVERLTTELDAATTRLRAQESELQQLRVEASTLRIRAAEIAVPVPVQRLPEPPPPPPSPGQPAAPTPGATEDLGWLSDWRASPDYTRDAEALRVVGAQGFALRESVARALGMDPRSGPTSGLFQRLREQWQIIAEAPAKTEVAGRPPNVLSLTSRGRAAYQALFGQEAVEPEFPRLVRRHKSDEQSALALQARLVLEDAGAEMVDLFPDPVHLAGGGKFEIDLVAVVDGQTMYAELERAAGRGQKRHDKWRSYARLTRDWYFFVPNAAALGRLMSELNFWAYTRAQDAAGVTVRVCQLTKGRDDGLWHLTKLLGGKK